MTIMQAWHNPNIISFDRCVPDFLAGRDTPRDFLERCLDVIDRKSTRLNSSH